MPSEVYYKGITKTEWLISCRFISETYLGYYDHTLEFWKGHRENRIGVDR